MPAEPMNETSTILISNTFALIAIMGAGIIFHKRKWLSVHTTNEITRLCMMFFYPCLIFVMMLDGYTLDMLKVSWNLPVGLFIIIAVGLLVGWIFRHLVPGIALDQAKALHYSCGFNNYSFLAIPLATALWGETGGAMVVCASLGAEILAWTFGISVASGDRIHPLNVLKMFTRPALISLVLSILLIILRDTGHIPALMLGWSTGPAGQALFDGMKLMGGVAVPMFMLLAGVTVAGIPLPTYKNPLLWMGVVLRLLIIPAILFILFFFIPWPEEYTRVLKLLSVMPASVMGISIIRIYGGDYHFCAAIVLITHLLAVVTIPLLLHFVL